MIYSLWVRILYPPINWISFISYFLTFDTILLTFAAHFTGNILYEKWKKPRIGLLGANPHKS